MPGAMMGAAEFPATFYPGDPAGCSRPRRINPRGTQPKRPKLRHSVPLCCVSTESLQVRRLLRPGGERR